MYIEEKSDGLVFKIFVQPKSSRNMIVGPHRDALKIKLTAPPVDGAANKMCIRFFSKILDVPKNSMEIQSGHAGRTKILRVFCRQDAAGLTERSRIRRILEKIAAP